MFRIVTRTHVFLAGVFAGIINTSVLTYILVDNERWNHKRTITDKTILATQMR
jgi:hypothetical protein